MNNRLQFRHHGFGSGYTVADGVFETRQEAIEYISHDIKNHDGDMVAKDIDSTFSLYGEPTVLRYKNEENESDPHVMLVIGSVTNTSKLYRDNKFCIIDIDKTESEIADIQGELDKVVKALTLLVNDTDTLSLTVDTTEDGTVLEGNVKLSEPHLFEGESWHKNNNIIATEDGLFMHVNLIYNEESNAFTFVVNDSEKSFTIENNNVVRGYYLPKEESLHLVMKQGDDVVINLEKLIAEWTVEGEATNSPIILKREEVGYGNEDAHNHVEPWQDILSADVRIADDRVNNILKKTNDNRYLYVDGVASNIVYYSGGTKTDVGSALNQLSKLKLSTDSNNILTEKVDGFFASTRLEYISDENALVFTTSSNDQDERIKVSKINLNSFDFVSGGTHYDSRTETLIIQYIDNKGKTKNMPIAIGDLLTEWEWTVNNYGHSVYLQKERSLQGADQLSADVNISDLSDNILKEVNHQLYVKGTADNIAYDTLSTVKTQIDGLKDSITSLNSDISEEAQARTLKDNELQSELNVVKATADASLKSVKNIDHSINIDNTDAVNPIVKVNLSTETANGTNIIKLLNDGLFANVDLDYTPGSNTLTFKTTNGTKTFNLISNSIVNKIYYDSNKEAIIIEYTVNGERMPDVEVPVRDLIDEWRVWDGHEGAVQLEKERVTSGTSGQDILKASVMISDSHSDNILVNDNGALYVSGKDISDNKSAIAALDTKVDDEIARATANETALQTAISTEASERIAAIGNEKERAISAETALNAAITSESNRATAAETSLQTTVNGVNSRVNTLENTVSTLDSKVDDEEARAIAAEGVLRDKTQDNTTAIAAEKSRAELAESNLSNAIEAEENRAKAAELMLDSKIDAKTFTITTEDTATLDLNVTDGAKISGNVLVANGANNIIKASSDSVNGTGLYASVDITYDAATNKLKLITSSNEKEVALSMGSIIKSIEYDDLGKNLIIRYETNTAGSIQEHTVSVPVEDLFNDWIVQEGEHLGGIILHKTNGSSGNPDVLSAEVVISSLSDNMLVNDQGALYVSKQPINEISAKTTDNKETIDKIIEGSGLATDGSFNYSSVIGHKYIADSENIMDGLVSLNDAVETLSGSSVSGIDSIVYDEDTRKIIISYKDAEGNEHTVEASLAAIINDIEFETSFDESNNVAFTEIEQADGKKLIKANVEIFDCGEF